ncbi:hypothetical protein M9H77_21324 [Catharanthus roseus]|uniref:Uncharacterized protein n=1 Tax=Catharanthus roseus TaxID=4058 RepID=A0ACC0AN18_CATRO|nr:hypothetical protein M9H77_21324 [Catharanthus roseus]
MRRCTEQNHLVYILSQSMLDLIGVGMCTNTLTFSPPAPAADSEAPAADVARLFEFVRSFELVLASFPNTNMEESARSHNTIVVPITNVISLEIDATNVYTRKVFIMVHEQLWRKVLYYEVDKETEHLKSLWSQKSGRTEARTSILREPTTAAIVHWLKHQSKHQIRRANNVFFSIRAVLDVFKPVMWGIAVQLPFYSIHRGYGSVPPPNTSRRLFDSSLYANSKDISIMADYSVGENRKWLRKGFKRDCYRNGRRHQLKGGAEWSSRGSPTNDPGGQPRPRASRETRSRGSLRSRLDKTDGPKAAHENKTVYSTWVEAQNIIGSEGSDNWARK